jgi:uncharacterized DUF497 family protein
MDVVRRRLHERRYRARTVDAYVHWIRRFIVFHGRKHPRELREEHVRAFLSHLAVSASASTQNQALAALTFLYDAVMEHPLTRIDGPAKARQNMRRHGVSFEEATTAFDDDLSLTMPDPVHSVGEERFVLLGRTSRGRLVVVAFTDRDVDIPTVRLISARLADHGERHNYEEGQS